MLCVLLEAPQQGTSNKYPHVFTWRNKKISKLFCWKKVLSGTVFSLIFQLDSANNR